MSNPNPSQVKTSEKPSMAVDHHPVQITNIKLNGNNFLRWSQSVRMYVRGRGKMGYLTGAIGEPAEKDASRDTWEAENSMIMTWLINSMEEDIGASFLCCQTAKEVWDNVSEMYSDLGNQSQVYELKLKIQQIRQGGDLVTKYYNTLKRLWQDLDVFHDYEWKCTDDCSFYRKIVDADRIFQFLAGLREEFDEVRGRILGRQPLPSIGEVFSEVRREESRRTVMLGKPLVENKPAAIERSALAIPEAHAGRAVAEKQRVWCDYCNKPRHTRETCWKLHRKPPKEKGHEV